MSQDTQWLTPKSLDEAVAVKAQHPGCMVLAGGTDLLVASVRAANPSMVLDIWSLAELCQVAQSSDGGWRLGAGVTYGSLLRNDALKASLPMLWQAAREIGALQIQARGTLGGNLVTSSPVGDTLPVWLALDAVIEIASSAGIRQVPYQDFVVGYRKTALAPSELVSAVLVPASAAKKRQVWRKVGTRRAQSISKVMAAISFDLDASQRLSELRIAMGAVADRPIRLLRTEAGLLGKTLVEAAELAPGLVAKEISPIDDLRSTASYRRQVAQNIIRGCFLDAT